MDANNKNSKIIRAAAIGGFTQIASNANDLLVVRQGLRKAANSVHAQTANRAQQQLRGLQNVALYTDSTGMALDGFAIVNGRYETLSNKQIVAIAVQRFARMQQREDAAAQLAKPTLAAPSSPNLPLSPAALLSPLTPVSSASTAFSSLQNNLSRATTRTSVTTATSFAAADTQIDTKAAWGKRLTRLAQDKAYAAAPELYALAHILQRPIRVILRISQGADKPVVVADAQTYGAQFKTTPLLLVHQSSGKADSNGNHYNALCDQSLAKGSRYTLPTAQALAKMTIVVPGDGNCAFHAIQAALVALGKSGERVKSWTHVQLRAQANTWLREQSKTHIVNGDVGSLADVWHDA